MIEIDIQKRSIGVNFNNRGEADIVVWAPMADKIELKNITAKKIIPLEKNLLGFWESTTFALQKDDLYKFLIDGDKEYPDPASLSQPKGVHGASKAVDVTNFLWTDRDWQNIPLENYVLYELHTGTFTTEGTFLAIEKKLDYLKELGITAIEIMPVAQFAGKRNWGYDGVYPFAVQNSYGGYKGFQQLVNVCHQKGLAVILDVVYNHLGPEGNYFSAYGPYFTEKYKTPWGGALNFDDAWCDGVRNYFIENALMWFRDFHIDALRLDAVHAIKDFGTKHILREIKEHVDSLMQHTGRQHYLIAECDLNNTQFIDPLEKRGFGMDAQWIDEFHHALRVTATGETTGYYSDFTGIQHLGKAYKDAYVYDGQFSRHRKKFFGKKTNNEGKQFVVFSQNHDQVGNRMLGERTSQLVSFEMQKLMAAAVFVSPFLPMLFMGEEWSEPNPFLYFVSHTDSDLAEAVRKGRKEEFAAFHAEGEAPDPIAEETFLQSKLQWHLTDVAEHNLMLNYYRTLIQLRKTHPALYSLHRKQLNAECNEGKKLLTLHRWHDSVHVVCFMNFSNSQQSFVLPAGQIEWHKIFDSSETKWGGSGDAPGVITAGNVEHTIELQPESILIYQYHVQSNNHIPYSIS